MHVYCGDIYMKVCSLRWDFTHAQGKFCYCKSQSSLPADTVFDTSRSPIIDTINVAINKIGEYYATFTLLVSSALNFYDSVHLVKNSDIKKLNYFLLNELKNTDFYGCYNDCQTCFDRLGTKPEFVSLFKSFYVNDSHPGASMQHSFLAWGTCACNKLNNIEELILCFINKNENVYQLQSQVPVSF